MPIRIPFLAAALRRSRFAAGLIRGGVSGLIGSVMGGWLGNVVNPDPDQPFRYASALIFALGYGLVFGIEGYRQEPEEDIRTTEALDPQWGRLLPSLIAGLLTGLLVGLVAGMLLEVTGALLTGDLNGAMLQRSLARGLFYALGAGITFGLSAAVLGSLDVKIIQDKIYPNQGIRLSIRNAMLVGAIVLVLSLVLYGLVYGILFDPILGVSIGLVVGAVLGTLAMLWYGSFDIVQHATLRLLLYREGHIPLNYARFLDYATERIFLRKAGGSYIFIHRLLMDHFAELVKSK